MKARIRCDGRGNHGATAYAASVMEHYRKAWQGDLRKVPCETGPTADLPAEFAVVTCPPTKSRNMWTYATVCMSRPADAEPLELHLFSISRDDRLAELLFATAHYHRTDSPLGLNHTVNFGRPWLPKSSCDHGLISSPYLDGPKLEWAEIESRPVRFLWMIPITASEVSFKRKNGIEALEKRFEETCFNYLDPYRKSTV